VKYAHITPIPMLEKILSPMVGADFHLVVSDQILEHGQYRDFYRGRLRQGEFVILDSPAFETGQQADLRDTVHAALLLQPSEVVLPDDLDSSENTVRGSKEAAGVLRGAGYDGRFMAVPHGSNLNNFLHCAMDLLEIEGPGTTTIGLQEEIPELFGISRQQMIDKINQWAEKTAGYGLVTFHLLGVDEALEDQYTVGARSCDSAKWVVWGLNGKMVEKGLDPKRTPPYPGRKSVGGRTGYFQYDTDDPIAIECARANVRKWRES
jgi:hypothetical protein